MVFLRLYVIKPTQVSRLRYRLLHRRCLLIRFPTQKSYRLNHHKQFTKNKLVHLLSFPFHQQAS